jgi:hypothetical protein
MRELQKINNIIKGSGGGQGASSATQHDHSNSRGRKSSRSGLKGMEEKG